MPYETAKVMTRYD